MTGISACRTATRTVASNSPGAAVHIKRVILRTADNVVALFPRKSLPFLWLEATNQHHFPLRALTGTGGRLLSPLLFLAAARPGFADHRRALSPGFRIDTCLDRP